MTDQEALKNNVQILKNIQALLARAPHKLDERQAVDQGLAFIQSLLQQSEELQKQVEFAPSSSKSVKPLKRSKSKQ